MLKKILLVIIPLLIVLQFFQPPKNTVENRDEHLSQISEDLNIPPNVFNVLETACIDCHANTTIYPWYSKLSPLNFWLNKHIVNGKKHLNFSVWNSYEIDKQKHKLEEIVEVIEKNEMPLKSYKIIHRNAILDDAAKTEIINWAESIK